MEPFDRLAESRIEEALQRGDFDALPGAGRPLELDDLSRVPAELRAGYLVLKSAGFLPEEMELRKETLRLQDLLRACVGDEPAGALRRELSAKLLRYRLLMERRAPTAASIEYGERILDRLG